MGVGGEFFKRMKEKLTDDQVKCKSKDGKTVYLKSDVHFQPLRAGGEYDSFDASPYISTRQQHHGGDGEE